MHQLRRPTFFPYTTLFRSSVQKPYLAGSFAFVKCDPGTLSATPEHEVQMHNLGERSLPGMKFVSTSVKKTSLAASFALVKCDPGTLSATPEHEVQMHNFGE